MNPKKPILFVDGSCVICNGFAQFILRADRARSLSLSTLQGKTALSHLPQGLRENLDTIVLLKNGRIFTGSSAVLNSLCMLGGIWRAAKIAFLIPEKIRDSIYSWIAKNRYRWFGKRDACALLAPKHRSRILE